MKTLVIDARMIGPKGHGISKYLEDIVIGMDTPNSVFQKLLDQLKVKALSDIRLIFLIQENCPENSPVRKFETIELNYSCYHPWSWIQVPFILKELKTDLYFNPTFASYPWLPCQYVQTVHDLNHLHFGNFLQKLYYNLLLRKSIKGAVLTLTVSQFIEDEIKKWIGNQSLPIQVYYNQITQDLNFDSKTINETLKKYGVQSKGFFLSVSNSKSHKNLKLLVDSYEEYAKKPSSIPLLITIQPGEIKKFVPGVYQIGSVSDTELRVLYKESKAFFFPSIYEGFGRPPIEAAMMGTKVYASAIPPHMEGSKHFQQNITFINPYDSVAWTNAFKDA